MSAFSSSSTNTKIIIISLVLFLLGFLIIIALHLYAEWFCRRLYHPQLAWLWTQRLHEQPSHGSGLEKAVVESLPAFKYKDWALSHNDALECSICLCEFQDDDKGRSLPNCSHSFHTHCIDVWFLSHTTCPLCRTSAQPPNLGQADNYASLNPHNIIAGQDPDEIQHRRDFFPSHGGEGDTNPVVQPSQNDIEGLIRIELSLDFLPSQYCRSSRESLGDHEFPTNVLFWGDHTHVSSRVSSLRFEQGLQGEAARPLPHVVIEIPTIQQNSRSPYIFSPASCSGSETQPCPCLITGQQPSKTPGAVSTR